MAATIARTGRRILRAPISVTPSAASRIKSLLASQPVPSPSGIRLGVRKRGCNGLSYTMNYAAKPVPGDEVVNEHGVTVYVDPKATFFIAGTKMDWYEDELGSEFKFVNPNQSGSCGCGQSFNVANSSAQSSVPNASTPSSSSSSSSSNNSNGNSNTSGSSTSLS